MGSLMGYRITTLTEGLSALLALTGFIPCVGSLMFYKISTSTEDVSTLLALIGFIDFKISTLSAHSWHI